MTARPSDDTNAPAGAGQALDVARIARLVDALEGEISRAPADSPDAQALRDEVARLRDVLAGTEHAHGPLRDALHAVRVAVERSAASLKGELQRDGALLAEIGRILGL